MKRYKLFFVILISMLLMLMLSGCSSDQLVYRVGGAAGQAEVTYLDGDGNTQTESVSLPWETSFKVGSSADFSLAASTEKDGVSCMVLLNDKELGSVDGALRYAGCSGSFKKSGSSLSTNFSSLKDVLPDGSPAVEVEEPVAEAAPAEEEPAVEEPAAEEPAEPVDLTVDFVSYTSEDGSVSLRHPPDWSPVERGSGVIVVINDQDLLGPVVNEGDFSHPAAFIIGNAESANNYNGDTAAAVLEEWEQVAGEDLPLIPLGPATAEGDLAQRDYSSENEEGDALNLSTAATLKGDVAAIFMSASTATASEEDAALAKAILGTIVIHKSSGSSSVEPTVAVLDDPDEEKISGPIIFSSDRGGNFDIYTMKTNGILIKLTDDEGFDGQPAWSPDGKSILFISDRSGNNDIYRMNADGSDVTQLTDDPGSDIFPTWLPSGALISFASDRSGSYDIFLMSPDGADQSPIFASDGVDTSPTWSPEAPIMAFTSDQSGQADLYTADADGNVLRLTEMGGVMTPHWSSNGRFIVFAADDGTGNSDIYIIRPDGSGVQAVTTDKARDFLPKWSPDTNHILFVSDRDGNPEIYTFDQDGVVERITKDTDNDNSPAWYPLP